MAGYVHVEPQRVPGSLRLDLVATTCPVTERYGETCQAYDQRYGTIHWCPFMYGLRIYGSYRERADLRSPDEARLWMATELDPWHTDYRVLCLRQGSANTLVGANPLP